MSCENKTKCYNIVECTTELILFDAPQYLIGDIYCYIQNNCTGKIYKYDTIVVYGGKLEVDSLDMVFSKDCTYNLWINVNEATPLHKEEFIIDGITTDVVTFGAIPLYTSYNTNATNYTSELKVDASVINTVTQNINFKTINSQTILGTGNIETFQYVATNSNYTGVDIGSATLQDIWTVSDVDVEVGNSFSFDFYWLSDNASGVNQNYSFKIDLGDFTTTEITLGVALQTTQPQYMVFRGCIVVASTTNVYFYAQYLQSGNLTDGGIVSNNVNFQRNTYKTQNVDITGNNNFTLSMKSSTGATGFIIRPLFFKIEKI